MTLDQLVHALDKLYAIRDWDQDAMSPWLPRLYRQIGYDHTQILEADFCARHNGLMLRSGDDVKQVYCAVFPSPDVLDHVLSTSSWEALLFLHHPIDMEVSGVGFLPIPPDALHRLRARGVSIYACHAPMDCHDEIGTNASIVQALGVDVERHFAPYGNGYAGRIGSIAPVSLDELIAKGREIFGVERVEIGGARPPLVSRIAIVPGGGDDAKLMEQAQAFGAQAYVTGEWTTRTTPPDEGGKEWAAANRAACMAFAEGANMALLGFSHAATEYLVMTSQLTGYFERQGLQVACLEQSDWWR